MKYQPQKSIQLLLSLVSLTLLQLVCSSSVTSVTVIERGAVRDWCGQVWQSNITCQGHASHQLRCVFTTQWSSTPDVALYFSPYLCWLKHASAKVDLPGGASVPKLLFYSEPPQYTPCLFDQGLISNFDLLAGWRTCSAVYYQHFFSLHSWALAFPAVDPSTRVDAIAYIQRNCAPDLERHKLVKDLIHLGHIEVHSYGSCMYNMHNRSVDIDALPPYDGPKPPTHGDYHQKLNLFRHYKFCMAAENHRYRDYISEKVWDALAVGCVPIYIGAPNIAEFLPDPDAVIMYDHFPSPALLMQELNRLRNNVSAYAAKLAWRSKPLSQLSPGFQSLVNNAVERGTIEGFQCSICRLVASARTLSSSIKVWQPPCAFLKP